MVSISNFANAHDFKIDNISIHNHSNATKHALEHLYDNCAMGALHNSSERCDAPKCHAETRLAVQEEILSWITHGERDALPRKVLWMSGPAGTGKTAIAGSIAETCKDRGLLAAAFFFSSFSGSKERSSKRCLVTTIAYQLLQHDVMHEVGRRILLCVQKNPGIFKTRLKDQLQELVLEPLREYQREGGDTSAWPKVVIIDGLDEVDLELYDSVETSDAHTAKEGTHLEVLSILMQAALDPSFPFCILVVSRPERMIRNFFGNDAKHITRNIFLDEKYDPDSDITLFLQSKFTEIRRRYNLPSTWPTEEAIRVLVENASGQFIYAATVVRFVQDPIQLPQAQLKCVLGSTSIGKNSNPFGPLDALYTRILKGSPNPRLVIMWLDAMRRGPDALPGVFWRQFLESAPGESEHLFANLSSLISVPSAGDTSAQYELYHKSFQDFTSNPLRCGDLFVPVDGRDGKRFFYEYRVLQAMKNKGPAFPIAEADLHAFLTNFFQLNLNNCQRLVSPRLRTVWDPVEVSWASPAMPEDDLLACDVGWLIHKAIEYVPLTHTRIEDDAGRYPVVVDTVVGAFWHVHQSCRWYRCRLVCKRWRTCILRVCKERGWLVPGRMALFRNRFIRYGPVQDPFQGTELPGETRIRWPWPGIQDFVPPEQRAGHGIHMSRT